MIYFDTSALISLFIKRSYSSEITRFIKTQNEPILIWSFGIVEFHSALKQLARMQEITENERQFAIIKLEVEINLGRIFVEKNVDADSIHELAILLIDKPEYRERAMDTIHVASAIKFKSSTFVSTDIRQQELARGEKLMVVPELSLVGEFSHSTP